jgi:hypothetical protein
MSAVGTLVAESIEVGRDLTVALTVRRLYRIAVAAPADGQPERWTLVDFTCADEDADVLAAQLADALLPGRWYCDYTTPQLKYVVFAGSIFRFPRGDRAGNAQAVEHGRRVGVPEAQLDWPP